MKTHKMFVLLILAAMVSCKKDKSVPHPSGDCNDLTGTNAQPAFFIQSPKYSMPCFNPNNPNEFVYYFDNQESGIFQLRKYNIQTAQNTLVANTGSIEGPIKWGRSGWIAYTSAPGYVEHIFIVKDNGEEITQFTTQKANYFPSWNDAGNELIWVHSPILGNPYYTLRQKLDQPDPDTIYYGSLGENDRVGDRLLSKLNINGTPYYGYYDLSVPIPFTESNFMPISDLYGGTSGLCWADNGQSFYVTHYAEGLYKVNVGTGQVDQLFDFCPSIRYEGISCSPDGRFLLGERVDSRVENGFVVEQYSIYLIDLQTMKETKMNLEQ